MSFFTHIILFASLLALVSGKATQKEIKRIFCSTVCKATHPVCARNGKCGAVRDCTHLPLTPEFRQTVLDTHNELRNKIATGSDKRAGNSAASNMNALSYDVELEFIAQCWINKCKFGHDKCRATQKNPDQRAGQNLAAGTMEPDALSTVKELINSWYEDEIEVGNAQVIDSFKSISKNGKAYGHFSQVVWAKTTHVGCGYSYKKKTDMLYLLCNYNDGNLLKAPIYKRGDPCSGCTGGKSCNAKYSGLCGNDEMDESESYPYYGGCSNIIGNHIIILFVASLNLFLFLNNMF